MTGRGHRAVGLAVAAMAAPAIATLYSPIHLAAFVAAVIAGSTAPDWLEIRIGGATLIKHRTITHVVAFWVAGVAAALISMWYGVIDDAIAIPVVGFFAGGLSHCFADMGTPTGVPLLNPFKRFSLNMWSARSEWIVIGVLWAVVGVFLVLTQSSAVNIEWVNVKNYKAMGAILSKL